MENRHTNEYTVPFLDEEGKLIGEATIKGDEFRLKFNSAEEAELFDKHKQPDISVGYECNISPLGNKVNTENADDITYEQSPSYSTPRSISLSSI